MAAGIDHSLLEAIKIHEERNLCIYLKEYIEILRQVCSTHDTNIGIAARGYALETDNYVFVIYSKVNWEAPFCNELAKNIRKKYNEVVKSSPGQLCNWCKCVVIPELLYAFRFVLFSKHQCTRELEMTASYRAELS